MIIQDPIAAEQQTANNDDLNYLESLFQMKMGMPNFKALKTLTKTKINPKDVYNLCISLIEKDDSSHLNPNLIQYIVNAITLSLAILRDASTWDKERLARFEKSLQSSFNGAQALLSVATLIQSALKAEAETSVGWNEVSELCNEYKKDLENNCTCTIKRWTFGVDVQGIEKSKNFQALLAKKEYASIAENFKTNVEDLTINAISLFKGGEDKEMYSKVTRLLPGLFLNEPLIMKDVNGNPIMHTYVQLVSLVKQPIKAREAQTKAFEALTHVFMQNMIKEATEKHLLNDAQI